MNILLKRWALGLLIGMAPCALSATPNSKPVKTLYDAADGFEFQYPASYFADRTTSGFRIEPDDPNPLSFLKTAEEFTISGCQTQGLESTGSCQITQKRQHRNPQGLQIAEVDMVQTCSGDCGDFIPAHFSVYVVNISQKGTVGFLVFQDMIEPSDNETLRGMAQTVKLILPKDAL